MATPGGAVLPNQDEIEEDASELKFSKGLVTFWGFILDFIRFCLRNNKSKE